MRLGLAVALAVAGWVLAGATAAAPGEPPARVPSWKQSHLAESDPAMRAVYILAVCARNNRREAAEQLLATAPGSKEERSRLNALLPSGPTECPIQTEAVWMRGTTLPRGAVAEAIYNGEDFKPKGPSALTLTETWPAPQRRSPLAVARWVARYAVRRAPLLAHAVVRGNPGSARELKALQALESTFTGCLPPGERLQISRLIFRAMIADELYRASVTFKESFVHAKG